MVHTYHISREAASVVDVSLSVENDCCDIQMVDSKDINAIIEKDPYMDGSEPDVLIDDCNPGVVADEGWVARGNGGYGLSFYELPLTDQPKSVVFTLDAVPSSGKWAVYSYQSANKKLTSVTSFEIVAGDKSYTVEYNRDDLNILGQTSGEWALLGEYEFEQGVPVTVTVSNAKADAVMRADAVLFVKK